MVKLIGNEAHIVRRLTVTCDNKLLRYGIRVKKQSDGASG